MKKPKKIDQHLLDLEATLKFAEDIVRKEKYSFESINLRNRAVIELSKYKQKNKNNKIN
jgi:hypothetical protein